MFLLSDNITLESQSGQRSVSRWFIPFVAWWGLERFYSQKLSFPPPVAERNTHKNWFKRIVTRWRSSVFRQQSYSVHFCSTAMFCCPLFNFLTRDVIRLWRIWCSAIYSPVLYDHSVHWFHMEWFNL